MNTKPLILVTGAKTNPATKIFHRNSGLVYLEYEGNYYKMNAAAGVVSQCAEDYELFVAGYQTSDAVIFQRKFGLSTDRFTVADLRKKDDVTRVAEQAVALKRKLHAPLWIVHYGGASDTKVDLPHNSLLAHTWDINASALPDLIENNRVTLLHLLKALKRKGAFDGQEVTKVIGITAAAAVRAKQHLGLDVVQKSAGHGLLRTMALDLTPENIFITEIMPGSTDTGFFDSDYTMNEAIAVTKNLGYDKTAETYPMFTAEQIGDAAKYVLDANCNVREVSLLPYGQFPHLGA